jgi:hypothetical protein
VLTLVELQTGLLKLDVKQCLKGLLVPAIALAAGAVLILSCLPILLAAVALLMVELFAWSLPQAFFFAVGCGLVLGGGACLGGAFAIRRSLAPLERSRSELVCNLTWIKQVLQRLGTPPRATSRWNGH